MDDLPVAIQPDFEREKWQAELELRRRELDIKEREQTRLALEAKRSRWWNPLFIAIVGATIAAAGSVFVSWVNGVASQQAEAVKGESARILEAIKATDTEKAKGNLRFMVAAGLISEPIASKIQEYLTEQPAGQGPVLPSASWSDSFLENRVGANFGIWRLEFPNGPYESLLGEIRTIAAIGPMRCIIYRRSGPQIVEDIKRHGGFDTPEMRDAVAKALAPCF